MEIYYLREKIIEIRQFLGKIFMLFLKAIFVKEIATRLVNDLRDKEILAEKDICQKSLKAQFKYADKKGAKFILTIGDNEVNINKAILKNLITGEEVEVKLESDDIIKYIKMCM